MMIDLNSRDNQDASIKYWGLRNLHSIGFGIGIYYQSPNWVLHWNATTFSWCFGNSEKLKDFSLCGKLTHWDVKQS